MSFQSKNQSPPSAPLILPPKTHKKLTPPPAQRFTDLEHKYSNLTSGGSDRGREDTRGRCRTHFRPEWGRDGAGWGAEGRRRTRPYSPSVCPVFHATPWVPCPTPKPLKGNHPRPLNATMVTARTVCRDPGPGVYRRTPRTSSHGNRSFARMPGSGKRWLRHQKHLPVHPSFEPGKILAIQRINFKTKFQNLKLRQNKTKPKK